MKIENKIITVNVTTKLGITPIEKKYSDLIIEIVNAPPREGGFTVTEMRSRLKLIEKLEKANGEIEFQHGELMKVKECLALMQWKFISKEIVEFTDAIEKL